MTPKKIVWGIAAFLGVLSAHGAVAATLSLSPSQGSYLVGHTFTLAIYVSAPDAAMNAAQGALSFPTDKLEILSLSKTGSVMSLWVQEPSFSNKDGTVTFGGVVTNPGFQGASGKILTITFRAKSEGTAGISFSSGSVLANDGKGTNILAGMQGATAALSATGGAVSDNGGLSRLPISSDPPVKTGTWYDINAITFAWSLPAGADGVSYAMSNSPGYALPQTPQGPVSRVSYNLDQFADGWWYFYLSFESDGIWSPISVRPLLLDRGRPEPFVIVAKDDDSTAFGPNPAFQWTTVDKVSGIAYYQAKIGDGDWFDLKDLRQGSVYRLPTQSPTDSRSFTVRAYDYAGNFRASSINFRVGSGCSTGAWCAVKTFFAVLASPWMLVIIACAALVGWLFYRVFVWKKALHKELMEFRSELHRDLKEIREYEKSPKEAVKHVEEDLQGEIKEIEKLSDKT